jgi:hypothetical protein
MSLAFHTLIMQVYEKYDDILIENPLLFVREAAHIKSIRRREGRQSGVIFLYVVLRM